MSIPSEEDIIKRKLLIDGDGSGDDRRINVMLSTFLKWCNESENEIDIKYERILLLLTAAEHSMEKSQQQISREMQEIDNYQELNNRIEQGIKDAQKKIVQLKDELEKAKIIKKNKQEYDVFASTILQKPDRKETEQHVEELRQDIENLSKTKDELAKKLELKLKQFQVFMSAAHELQNTID